MIIEKPIRRMETMLARSKRQLNPGYKRFLGTLPKCEIEARCRALAKHLKVPL